MRLIRYINERFTNIELVLGTDTGLKIPNSAITKKEFFIVGLTILTEPLLLSFIMSDESSESPLAVK